MKPKPKNSFTRWPQPLGDAVEGLYAAFAHYPLKPHLDNCPHCSDARDDKILHAAPLRELTAEQLGFYAFSSMYTMGDGMDYRHFLPRILELSLTSNVNPGLDPWHITDKLNYTGFGFLPANEHAAIAAFTRSLWAVILTESPAHTVVVALPDSSIGTNSIMWSAEDVLRMAAEFTGEFEQCLALWHPVQDKIHLRHFADLVLMNSGNWGPNDLPFVMMTNNDARLRLKSWVLDPAKLAALESAAYSEIETLWADAFDTAAQVLSPHVEAA